MTSLAICALDRFFVATTKPYDAVFMSNAVRNPGFSVTVSTRALNFLDPAD